ncbi:ATP-binding protein [Jatrophihabitans cynanchi]|jgi:signal transduction histidine kinase|uniref:histidine kinase n=1 Tax=Jatrophihabitans cynanchi TaxID=2944128 RepID=A0ABY7JTH9_9ACTN|nr:ATP-binding protein [Jatrophihabitans sp. SB3-54]WAX55340.1 ATP-binding protein [Jatrophihabitans sp. SB3-54]
MAGRGWSGLGWPARWWARQSLRARLTLLATALFSLAVATGAVLLLVLQRYALVRVLDSSAQKTASDIARQFRSGKNPTSVLPTTGGITAVQVVNAQDVVIAASPGADRTTPVLDARQLREARKGARLDIDSTTSDARLRVLAQNVGGKTVLVVSDISRVDDSLRILGRAALIGGPIAVLLMGLATYAVVALTLRPVAALRHGAADITAAGLADQRLPVPGAHDEIHRLAVTLNAMLDRIDAATARQRTFIGDAAHELRSPLASLRVQLEVAQRMGPASDWSGVVDDVMLDVERLNRLVEDLLALARMDEARSPRREPVRLDDLVSTVVDGYEHARVPVHASVDHDVTVQGDPDGLHRVLINLLDNAVRYADTEVAVEVRLGNLAGRRVVRLSVADDGPGIAPAERERVFDRFYRIEEARDRETGGTGLGLPIVRDLVRAHGGSVRLTDRASGQRGLLALVVLPADAA